MPLATARARMSTAEAYPFDPYREHLRALARWCYRISPVCAVDNSPEECPIPDPRYDGLNIDISGSERLFQGEEKLLKHLSQTFSTFGLRSRLAIAPTLGAAWALARYSTRRLQALPSQGPYPEETIRHTLAPLPITGLRLSRSSEQELTELNITRIEHLFHLSRKELAARFEPELIKRLSQALGKEAEPLEAEKPEPIFFVEKVFDGPTTDMTAIAQTCSKLLQELLARLEPSQRTVSQFELRITTVDREVFQKHIPLSFPSRDRKHLWSLIQTQIEKLSFRSGVEQIRLSAPQLGTLQSQATSYFPEEYRPHSEEVAQFFDSLHNTLGKHAVLQMQPQGSHLPERAFTFRPWASKVNQSAPTLPDRPSILFNPPQSVRAMSMLPDNPPAWLKWKEQSYNIEQGLGPERISSPWWEGEESLSRDYFKVQLPTGLWLWIFRECETSRWYVHGLWA